LESKKREIEPERISYQALYPTDAAATEYEVKAATIDISSVTPSSFTSEVWAQKLDQRKELSAVY
jgi:hypothetical protein